MYAVSVRRLIALPEASSRRSLTVPPLPSASIWANGLNTLTGFTHRGLTPHKFTPVPGVHQTLHQTPESLAVPAGAGGGAGELVVVRRKDGRMCQSPVQILGQRNIYFPSYGFSKLFER